MRIEIIKSSDKINEILKKGTKINSRSFVLFYLPAEAEVLQFAAIAGKKTFKRAVDRNFVKRRIRHLVRDLMGGRTSEIKHCNLRILVLAKHTFATLKFSRLVEEFKNVARFHGTSSK
ncbi:MAG: ribonuclease P protein component [Candidatus Jidaibacter sp.]|jgi:ribonuclease P protein component|nr:ribonuclease P protein component [Candidatus Jidaibacter sp.]